MSEPRPKGSSSLFGEWRSSWHVRTALLALGAGLLVGVISLLLPKSYKSEAKILPNMSGQGSSLFNLAAASGLGDFVSEATGGSENPTLTYPEILTSKAVLERVATSRYPAGSNHPDDEVLAALGAKARSRRFRVEEGIRLVSEAARVYANPRSGIIVVSAVTRDSVLSAFIVQRLLSELDQFNMSSRSSRGRAGREFIEGRLKDARVELADAEQALVSFRQANVKISYSPALQLQQARLEREVETRSEVSRLLARQYESARIEEKRDTPTFSVIDPPKPPVRKCKPRVLFNVIVAIASVIALRIVIAQFLPAWFRRGPTLRQSQAE